MQRLDPRRALAAYMQTPCSEAAREIYKRTHVRGSGTLISRKNRQALSAKEPSDLLPAPANGQTRILCPDFRQAVPSRMARRRKANTAIGRSSG